jgi:hypothetical protein
MQAALGGTIDAKWSISCQNLARFGGAHFIE